MAKNECTVFVIALLNSSQIVHLIMLKFTVIEPEILDQLDIWITYETHENVWHKQFSIFNDYKGNVATKSFNND